MQTSFSTQKLKPAVLRCLSDSALPDDLRLKVDPVDMSQVANIGDVLDAVRLRVGEVDDGVPGLPWLDMYAAMSALQKAVRLGNLPLAVAASRSVIEGGNIAANWRRIRTIAVEDIGVGDPEVTAFVLWLAWQKDLHKELGDLRLSALALRFLGAATKSRDMSDVAFWATLPGAVDYLMDAFGEMDSDRLVAIASSSAETFGVRHAAARALFPVRFEGASRWRRRRPEDRAPLYEALGLPPALVFTIEADVAFGGDVLTSAGPLVWALMSQSPTVGTGADPLDPGDFEMVHGVLGSTFDRHTRVGHRVLGTMLKEHPPWVDFFQAHPQARPKDCILRAVFYAEGGVLRPRLTFEGSDDLYWSILEAKFATTGIPTLESGVTELLRITHEALPVLNERRRQALSKLAYAAGFPAGLSPRNEPGLPSLPGEATTMLHADPTPSTEGPPRPKPNTDESWRRFVWMPGEATLEPAPKRPSELGVVPVANALAKLDALPSGSASGTLACPLPVAEPPLQLSDLDLTSYTIMNVDIGELSSVVTELDREATAALIASREGSELPLVISTSAGHFLYSGLERVIALGFLGDVEIGARVVFQS
jgi:hypothetical protein